MSEPADDLHRHGFYATPDKGRGDGSREPGWTDRCEAGRARRERAARDQGRPMTAVRLMVAAVALGLVACGPAAEEIGRGPVREMAGTTGCNHYGYCYTCAPGATSFKLECKFKLSHFCPGEQAAELQVQDVTYRRGEETFTQTATLRVLRTTGACR